MAVPSLPLCTSRLVLHQPAVDSPTLMLIQITLVKRNEAQNKTETHKSRKGTGREEEWWIEMREKWWGGGETECIRHMHEIAKYK